MPSFDSNLVAHARAALAAMTKQGFTPAGPTGMPPAGPPPAGPPMPPAGAPPAGAPMPPEMAGGMPPGAPMTPEMAGGMPPGAPPGGGGEMPIMVNLQDLISIFQQVSEASNASQAAADVPNEDAPKMADQLKKLNDRLDGIESLIGGLLGGGGGGEAMPPLPPEQAGAAPLVSEAPPMGMPMPPMPEATAAPMPAMGPMGGMTPMAGAENNFTKIGRAQKIGDLIASLRGKNA